MLVEHGQERQVLSSHTVTSSGANAATDVDEDVKFTGGQLIIVHSRTFVTKRLAQ